MDRAVLAVQQALERFGAPVYVRKEIVHNRHVVGTLERMGAVFVDEVDAVPEGANVVFSAHGVSPAVVRRAADRGLAAIDATCPLVTKVHREAQRFARDERHILLVGHAGHEEVEGTMGHAPGGVTLVESPAHADVVQPPTGRPLVWLSQTTLSVDETMETVRRLRLRFPELADPPSDDICYATQNRQLAVRKLAAECDVVLVVGSANSSNTLRLVDVALEHGARAAYRIDFVEELRPEWLEGARTVGVTSGASAPEVLVQELLDDLVAAGFDTIEPVVTGSEDLVFSLPRELRPDRGSAPRGGRRTSSP